MVSFGKQKETLKPSKFFGTIKSPTNLSLLRKSSDITLNEKTRFEKIRTVTMVYPKSTPTKIVFVSNSYGNGFRNEKVSLPAHLNVEEMKEQLDNVCYEAWRLNKEIIERSAFERHETIILFMAGFIGLVIALLFLSLEFEYLKEEYTTTLIFIGIFGTLVSILTAMSVYLKENEEYDYDLAIIRSIKQTLFRFNREEQEAENGFPRFRWSCNNDCRWVAVELLKQEANE